MTLLMWIHKLFKAISRMLSKWMNLKKPLNLLSTKPLREQTSPPQDLINTSKQLIQVNICLDGGFDLEDEHNHELINHLVQNPVFRAVIDAQVKKWFVALTLRDPVNGNNDDKTYYVETRAKINGMLEFKRGLIELLTLTKGEQDG